MIDKLELIALKSVALRDSEYFCRRVYRYYSEKFHTPLAEVHKLSWGFVFTHYLEHIIETNNTQEQIYNLAVDHFHPDMKKVKNFMGEFESEEEEVQAYIKKIEEEEKAKLEKQKVNPHKEQEIKSKEINMDSTLFEHLDEEMEQD